MSIINKSTLQDKSQLQKIETYVIKQFNNVEAGHDLSHIERVYSNTLLINKQENGKSFLVEAGALLHDISDDKLFDKEKAEDDLYCFLRSINIKENYISELISIINNVSFGNSINNNIILNKEQKIVRDADRLDAIGAIGIARAFQYGGYKNRALIDLNIPPASFDSKDAYRNSQGSTINHFYEKLLLLKDKMETPTGRLLAEQRHIFMIQFLKQLYKEIDFEGFDLKYTY